MFNAAIINVESGAQIKGESVDYQSIEDGPEAIQTLAIKLTLSVGANDFRVSNYQGLLAVAAAIHKGAAGNYTIILAGDITMGQNDKVVQFTGNAQKTVTVRGEGGVRSI
jgi:hypothetical protein